MKNKYIINWELLLKCNLNCSFCSQKARRKNNKSILKKDEIIKIINNLPKNTHISFLWWETLLFPDIIEIFKTLEKKWITYEITTNGLLLNDYILDFKILHNLKQINISIDWYWTFHDISRWKKWLFENIIKVIPKLLKYKQIFISTVITNKLDEKNLIKLYILLNKLWMTEHKLIYLMNFSNKQVLKSKEKISSLSISTPWDSLINCNENYKNDFLKKYKILKNLWLNTNIQIEPISIFNNKSISCKQIENQYRINENGKLSICEFINNSFWDLINNKFETEIQNIEYNIIKNQILKNFPLDICKTCCKQKK